MKRKETIGFYGSLIFLWPLRAIGYVVINIYTYSRYFSRASTSKTLGIVEVYLNSRWSTI